jgi:hypothetical protein
VKQADYTEWTTHIATYVSTSDAAKKEKALASLVEFMKNYPETRAVFPVIAALGETHRRLRDRIIALEKRETSSYEGVWRSDVDYGVGKMVTHQGSIWACLATGNVGVRPGAGGTEKLWRLAVKRGRDGRDLRGAA